MGEIALLLASASIVSSLMALSMVTVVLAVVTAWKEEEEDKRGKGKTSPFSKQVGVVLERENKFFLGRK